MHLVQKYSSSLLKKFPFDLRGVFWCNNATTNLLKNKSIKILNKKRMAYQMPLTDFFSKLLDAFDPGVLK
jgi:hypothetical protein